MLFPVDKKLVFTSRKEELAENMFQLKKKLLMEENAFPSQKISFHLLKYVLSFKIGFL